MQEFGYIVEGVENTVSANVEQGSPLDFTRVLSDLLSHDEVSHVSWVQNFKTMNTSRGRRRKMIATFCGYQTGLSFNHKEWDSSLHVADLIERYPDNDEEATYLTEFSGIKLGSIPEELDAFSRLLGKGTHSDLLFNSFGDNVTVKATKTPFSMRFEVKAV